MKFTKWLCILSLALAAINIPANEDMVPVVISISMQQAELCSKETCIISSKSQLTEFYKHAYEYGVKTCSGKV